VVWNSSAYESPDALRQLEGLVDIYLPDVKYFSSELSSAYSAAPDYFEVATRALEEMLRQVGGVQYSEDGMLARGVIVRHLILPSCRADSIALLRQLHERFGKDAFLLSLMGQYTPDFAPADAPRNLRRRLTSFEYDYVMAYAQTLGFEGFFQGRDAANAAFTPNFEERDLLDDFLNKRADGAK
jgi:putative pyruvate formate lyase activating enzyme